MTPRTLLARDPALLSETEWSSLVVEVARLGGWTLRYHTFTARGTKYGRPAAPGFPDWVLVKEGRLIFAELKTEVGKLTDEQQLWHEGLLEVERNSGGFVQVYVWRPSDWPEVVETLTGKRPREET